MDLSLKPELLELLASAERRDDGYLTLIRLFPWGQSRQLLRVELPSEEAPLEVLQAAVDDLPADEHPLKLRVRLYAPGGRPLVSLVCAEAPSAPQPEFCASCHGLENEVGHLKAELKGARRLLAKRRRLLARERTTSQCKREEAQERQEQLDALQNDHQELNEHYASLYASFQTLQQERDRLQQELDAQERELNRLRDRLQLRERIEANPLHRAIQQMVRR